MSFHSSFDNLKAKTLAGVAAVTGLLAAPSAFAQTAPTTSSAIEGILDGVDLGTIQTTISTVGLVILAVFATFVGIRIGMKLLGMANKG
jgi:hypothetical protein